MSIRSAVFRAPCLDVTSCPHCIMLIFYLISVRHYVIVCFQCVRLYITSSFQWAIMLSSDFNSPCLYGICCFECAMFRPIFYMIFRVRHMYTLWCSTLKLYYYLISILCRWFPSLYRHIACSHNNLSYCTICLMNSNVFKCTCTVYGE